MDSLAALPPGGGMIASSCGALGLPSQAGTVSPETELVL